MPPRFRCVNGHFWEDSTQPPVGCPTCGGAYTLAEAGNGSRDDQMPTTVLPAAQPLVGALFGQEETPPLPGFEILSRLGRGGMGVVYKARQKSDGRIVALKVIRRDRLQHEDAVRRFRREAQALARLSHPNIVQVLDADQEGDLHYLVMEYIEGVNLDQLVSRQGAQPLGRAVDFMRQAALGLQHAFERGLVHRDIKPSNLMVTPTPPPAEEAKTARYQYVVKVLDLSVARLLNWAGQSDSLSTLTQGGAVIGTADFVAPEQLEDPRHADIRSDLYSLGCTFYYLLTGQVPFPGGTLVAKLDQQRWQTATSIHQLRDGVPPALVHIVQRLMAKNPRDRFKTPGELVHALEQLPRTSATSLPQTAIAPKLRWEGHSDCIWRLAVDEEAGRVLSASKDRSARLWDATRGEVVRVFGGHNGDVRAAAFIPQTRLVALAVGAGVRLFDAATGQEVQRLSGHTAAVKCLLAAPDGKRLYSAGEDRSIRVWELPGGRDAQRLSGHTAEVTALALVDVDGPLISASRDQTIKIWDLRSGQATRSIPAGGTAILAMAFAPPSRFLLTGHFDTLIRLWDMDTGRELRRFLGHKQMVTAVEFLHDGERFVSASQDGTVRLWDMTSGVDLAQLTGVQGPVHALAVFGERTLAGGADGLICGWNVAG